MSNSIRNRVLNNILIIGDSKPQSDSDQSFNIFTQYGYDFCFLNLGKTSSQLKSKRLNPYRFIRQIQNLIIKKNITVIYLRADWFDAVFLYYAKAICSFNFGIPLIVGYHCHTAKKNNLEKFVLENADAHIFINNESQEYFHDIYDLCQPFFIVPSLFLPNLEWYDIRLKEKLSDKDGEIHCVIPTSAIRIATPPMKQHDKIHIENYLYDRYDYYQIIKKLIREKIHVHIYGNFKAPLKGYSKITEEIYRILKNNEFGEFFHIEGFYKKNDFNSELSKYDFAIFTGFIPNQEVPPFEHMNYQVRFNPTLAAELPVFMAANTGGAMEGELNKHGQGYIFHSITDITKVACDSEKMSAMKIKCKKAQKFHSNDYWMPKMLTFFKKIAEEYSSSSVNIYSAKTLQNEALISYIRGKTKALIDRYLK